MWTSDPSLALLIDLVVPRVQAHGCWPQTLLLSDVLSAGECANIINALEGTGGFGAAKAIATGNRNNDVLVWIAPPELMSILWARVGPMLRSAIPAAHALNARLRVYRYQPGQDFKAHHDASQPPSTLSPATVPENASASQTVCEGTGQRSSHSLLLFLNSGSGESFKSGSQGEGGSAITGAGSFCGGATALYPNGDAGAPVRITPRAGCGLVFPHGEPPRSLLHAGEKVTAGTKYVLRTDLF